MKKILNFIGWTATVVCVLLVFHTMMMAVISGDRIMWIFLVLSVVSVAWLVFYESLAKEKAL